MTLLAKYCALGLTMLAVTACGGGNSSSTITAANPGVLALAKASYSVAQNSGTASVTVNRTRGTVGQVMVNYATADNSAKAGTDYTSEAGTLIWTNGEATAQTVTIPISDVSPFTGSKTFTFSLSGATGGAGLGVATANVTINGDGSAVACPYGTNFEDGCVGAPSSGFMIANFFTGYTGTTYPVRPPWNVAGVDYPVGFPPSTAFADPATAALPAGCSYTNLQVTCNGNNITVTAFDFSLHGGVDLVISGANNTVSSNKFALAPNCNDPVINYTVAANSSMTIARNTFDGGGATCGSLVFGTMLFGVYEVGASGSIEYNYFLDTPQDVTDMAGPNSGAATLTMKYNLVVLDGWQGHPDGTQFNGGNFNGISIDFNTFYNNPIPTIGTQPFHIEAQLTAALNNSSVSYNTLATTGSCNGGANYPVGCSANYDIACKQDSGNNTNTNFVAYGNYIDWSGAVAALTNAYACPSTTWGMPIPNYDLGTGQVLPPP